MAIYNLGSINADLFYRVPHLPQAGETLAASSRLRGLGGKGANMSVAAARAASRTIHIGAVGNDGKWAIERLMEYGVDTRHISVLPGIPTGHAIINVDDVGENAIVLLPGANAEITEAAIGAALSEASPGDTLLIQNETNNQAYAAQMARSLGLFVAYAAAPFDAEAVQSVLPYLDFLILNTIEATQFEQATGQSPEDLDEKQVIVTRGSQGCTLYENRTENIRHFPALPVTPVDTTGAGDTFTGYVLAALDRGMPMAQAIGLATRAAALMVTRHGTADVIPDLKEVQDASF
ncbi:ribokinase [Shimia gijangensis]|uniref:Ribokinase n=1 Tax=Shimia gijangensis TaxID=1470563 RepID=A0A1M6MQQ0_9RHOB|nr:ribokinase [Shimia gijangensis]SHJ85801.1 ribokinase [Shimia gijangensis]